MRVNHEENAAHAELQMIKHPQAIIRRIKEDHTNTQPAAKMVKELDPQHQSVPQNLRHHHLKEDAELLQTRQGVLALKELRQLLHFLHQGALLGPRDLHLEAVDGLAHLKFAWMEIGGVGGKALLLAIAKETREVRNDRVRFEITQFNHWKVRIIRF